MLIFNEILGVSLFSNLQDLYYAPFYLIIINMSSDLKLNNLVDLLLVIGSDPSSGLELLKSSRAFQSRNKSRENEAKYDSSSHSCNGNMTSSNEEKANSVGLPDEDDDLMMKLTDPEANYDAKVSSVCQR